MGSICNKTSSPSKVCIRIITFINRFRRLWHFFWYYYKIALSSWNFDSISEILNMVWEKFSLKHHRTNINWNEFLQQSKAFILHIAASSWAPISSLLAVCANIAYRPGMHQYTRLDCAYPSFPTCCVRIFLRKHCFNILMLFSLCDTLNRLGYLNIFKDFCYCCTLKNVFFLYVRSPEGHILLQSPKFFFFSIELKLFFSTFWTSRTKKMQ